VKETGVRGGMLKQGGSNNPGPGLRKGHARPKADGEWDLGRLKKDALGGTVHTR